MSTLPLNGLAYIMLPESGSMVSTHSIIKRVGVSKLRGERGRERQGERKRESREEGKRE